MSWQVYLTFSPALSVCLSLQKMRNLGYPHLHVFGGRSYRLTYLLQHHIFSTFGRAFDSSAFSFFSPPSNMLEHIFYIRPGKADQVEGADKETGVFEWDPLFCTFLPYRLLHPFSAPAWSTWYFRSPSASCSAPGCWSVLGQVHRRKPLHLGLHQANSPE